MSKHKPFRSVFYYQNKNTKWRYIVKVVFPPLQTVEIGEIIWGGVYIPHSIAVISPYKAGKNLSVLPGVVILTSNAGAQNIVAPKRLGFLSTEDERKDYEYMKGQVMEEVKRMFKPEFLNRIDEIIVFHQLTKADMKKILQILLKDLERRCKEQMDIELKVRDTVKEYLVENSFDSKYGARPLKRAIQSKIEDPLAEAILNGEVKKGDTVAAGMNKKEITFKVLEKK